MKMKASKVTMRSCIREISRLKKASNRVLKWVEHCWFHHDDHDDDEPNIPKDVPKGHLVVYVGEDEDYCKRFVIRVSMLNHPLFKALLDHAEDVFGFTNNASSNRLHLPCNETIFLNILHKAKLVQHRHTLFPCF